MKPLASYLARLIASWTASLSVLHSPQGMLFSPAFIRDAASSQYAHDFSAFTFQRPRPVGVTVATAGHLGQCTFMCHLQHSILALAEWNRLRREAREVA